MSGNRVNPDEAVRKAKEKLGLSESFSGKAWEVRRLDRPSTTYYLVEIKDAGAVVAIVVVNTNTGEIDTFARLSGAKSPIQLDAQTAIELTAEKGTVQAELVWMPCTISKSPFYPFWEVKTPTTIKYVDQRGQVFDRFEIEKPG